MKQLILFGFLFISHTAFALNSCVITKEESFKLKTYNFETNQLKDCIDLAEKNIVTNGKKRKDGTKVSYSYYDNSTQILYKGSLN